MVDLDGVVYPFTDMLREWLVEGGRKREDLPDALSWEFFSDQWGLTTKEFLATCADAVDAGFLFRKGAPIEGSVEALTRLKAAAHSIHVVTDRSFGSRSVENTEAWLRTAKVPYDSLTFSADKTIVDADLYIDDRDKNIWAVRAAGRRAVVFDQAWNRHVEGLRVRDWKGVVNLVEQVVAL